MRWVWLIIGVLVAAAGVVFTLQGLGILQGSAMSGSHTWVVLGPIIAIIGLALVGVGVFRGAPASR
ncbi:MAG TPA: hypothetical protein VKQ36_14735 [Ktedonobacterales bacterium]|nr:hypothetical protein [Ktedonobacterales bacterium]